MPEVAAAQNGRGSALALVWMSSLPLESGHLTLDDLDVNRTPSSSEERREVLNWAHVIRPCVYRERAIWRAEAGTFNNQQSRPSKTGH